MDKTTKTTTTESTQDHEAYLAGVNAARKAEDAKYFATKAARFEEDLRIRKAHGLETRYY